MAVLQYFDKMEREVQKVEKHHASESSYSLCKIFVCNIRIYACAYIYVLT